MENFWISYSLNDVPRDAVNELRLRLFYVTCYLLHFWPRSARHRCTINGDSRARNSVALRTGQPVFWTVSHIKQDYQNIAALVSTENTASRTPSEEFFVIVTYCFYRNSPFSRPREESLAWENKPGGWGVNDSSWTSQPSLCHSPDQRPQRGPSSPILAC